MYVLPQPGAVLGTGRTWVGPYLMTERSLLTWPAQSLLLQTDLPLYAASLSPSGDLLVALTPTEALFIYPRAPLRWKHQWPFPVTQVKAVGGRWIAWQGETAFRKRRAPLPRYPPRSHPLPREVDMGHPSRPSMGGRYPLGRSRPLCKHRRSARLSPRMGSRT